MSGFVLYDDAIARAAEPFALTRPFGELRAGALLIRERWARVLACQPIGFAGAPHLAAFDEFGSPPAVRATLPRGTIVVNSRCAPALTIEDLGGLADGTPGASLACGDTVAAVVLATATPSATFATGRADLAAFARGRGRQLRGWWLASAWDLVRVLPDMLAADAAVLASDIPDEPPAHVVVLGAHRLAAERGAYFEPGVVVDTSGGDVVVRTGARISAFTRIAGPGVIGADTVVAGGKITCCAVGEHSRVCGEMSVTIVAGYTNKAHDGFIGHSVLGRWANLGAGTITSNLKNSYGRIRVETRGGVVDTDMQFLGSLVGDHAKTAIGTRLTTGTIVGAGANVFGDRAPAKYVPPFAWGDQPPFERYELEKFLEVAEHVMSRRSVQLSRALRAALADAWRETQGQTPTEPGGRASSPRKGRRRPPRRGSR